MAAPEPLPILAGDDATARAVWIATTVTEIQTQFLDGIVFDFEAPLLPTDPANSKYVSLVAETRAALHARIPGSQVSVCLAWSPHGVDGRYYDNIGLIEAADLGYIMGYDTRSQVMAQCVASANAALPALAWGLREYMTLGADSQKLVLGVPWYGYDYRCIPQGEQGENGSGRGERGREGGAEGGGQGEGEDGRVDPTTVTCAMELVPFRGVGCSDAAGKQVPYSTIQARLTAGETSTGRRWDGYMQTPFYNYVDLGDGSVHQVHYDDSESLRVKYDLARQLGLRGVGPYTFDDVWEEGEGGREGEGADAMWAVLRMYVEGDTATGEAEIGRKWKEGVDEVGTR